MARVIKSEWHQVEKRYAIEFDESTVAEVYPDMTDEEVAERYEEIVNGKYLFDEFLEDAMNEGVDFDWDWLDEDDWWTDRKGGYDVTYDIEGE
jgi:hypothetical protein